MNVVWHGNYVKYFETARCALLEEIGYDYEAMRADGYAYPIVKIEAKYVKPVFFGDEIEVEATLKECECFLKIGYVVKKRKNRRDAVHGHELASSCGYARDADVF